jgi:hypothetical protein
MDNQTVRAALQRRWQASDANDFAAEHESYREDAVLEYPQSGERIRGRHNIRQSPFVQPTAKRFTVRRIVGGGELGLTEFMLSYDGVPSYAVSIMEFRDGGVVHETQYFAQPFEPSPSRAHLGADMISIIPGAASVRAARGPRSRTRNPEVERASGFSGFRANAPPPNDCGGHGGRRLPEGDGADKEVQ